MNHHELHVLLLVYVDDELSPTEKSVVAAHLMECAECRRRVDELGTLKRNVQAAGDIDLPYSFASSLVRAIHHDDEVNVSWLGIEHFAGKFVIGLALLVILFVGLMSSRQNEEPFPVERYVSGLNADSSASQILAKRGALTRDDVMFAVLTK
jgi:anti-sigma factor RsiW